MDMCDWNGKTLITYLIGNQLGFYYMAEAEYDGCVADFLEPQRDHWKKLDIPSPFLLRW